MRYAVVGASGDPKKYGYKVFKALADQGIDVVPVNRRGGTLLGDEVYVDLSHCPAVDVAVFVVPPQVTERLMEEVRDLGIPKVWLQPGSESERVIQYCCEHGIECVHGACIMTQPP